MGSEASVGSLTYTVVDTEWKESLPSATGSRLPAHRFLLVNVSVINKGSDEIGVPMLTLVDTAGKEYQEQSNGEGVPQWLGYIRRAEPSEALSGRLLFDVPPGGYRLRISSGGDAESESLAHVEIPFRAEASPVKGVDPMASPAPAK